MKKIDDYPILIPTGTEAYNSKVIGYSDNKTCQIPLKYLLGTYKFERYFSDMFGAEGNSSIYFELGNSNMAFNDIEGLFIVYCLQDGDWNEFPHQSHSFYIPFQADFNQPDVARKTTTFQTVFNELEGIRHDVKNTVSAGVVGPNWYWIYVHSNIYNDNPHTILFIQSIDVVFKN